MARTKQSATKGHAMKKPKKNLEETKKKKGTQPIKRRSHRMHTYLQTVRKMREAATRTQFFSKAGIRRLFKRIEDDSKFGFQAKQMSKQARTLFHVWFESILDSIFDQSLHNLVAIGKKQGDKVHSLPKGVTVLGSQVRYVYAEWIKHHNIS
jgi:hypothetical protein